MSNKLHFYTKYSKEKIKISDKPFASGGEGAIYAIASPRHYSHLVAKIYYPEKRTEDREAKMHYLMQHPPITFQKGQPPSIGWVQDVIYKEQRFLGILLIRIEGEKLTKLTLAKLPRRANKAWHRFALKDPNSAKLRLRTCFNLAVVIYQIHEKGQYVLVDLKPDNILMQPNGLLAVVDMDSVEVIEDGKAIFAAPVATPEYTPPEHYIGSRTVIEETWDRFSLGVIFYQLLLGLHPFAAMSHPPYDNLVSIHDKIQEDLFVHNVDKEAFFKVIPPPHKRYHELPPDIQQLFQNCFVEGAKIPSSRPSALDWCVALADFLNLPFKGMPDYDFPLKSLPKIDFQPSDLFFVPSLHDSTTMEIESVPYYTPYSIDSIDLRDIKPLIIEPNKPSIPLQIKQKNIWVAMETAYKEYLHDHRKSLWTAVYALMTISLLSFYFPWIIILALILFFFAFPKLMFRSSKDVIYNIGQTVLPTSIQDISSKQQDVSASNEQLTTTIEHLNAKKSALSNKLYQFAFEAKQNAKEHIEKIAANEKVLISIHKQIKRHKSFTDALRRFNPWVEQDLKLQLEETRAKELEAYNDIYKVFSKQFLVELKERKGTTRNAFRKLNTKKIQLEKAISIQEEKLPIAIDEGLKEQLRIDYTEALEANKLHYTQLREVYQINNQKPLPDEIDYSKLQETLDQKLDAQLKQNKRRKESELKKAKKKLGKNFQVNLKPYLDLLYESGDATKLHFVHERIQEQFQKFQVEISNLNSNKALKHQLSELFTPEATSKWGIIPQLKASDLAKLEKKQGAMLDEWTTIEAEFKKLQKKITLIEFGPKHIKKQVLEEIRNSILNIKSSENTYHEAQKTFYNNPKIAQIHKELKVYKEIEQNKESLELNFSNKTTDLLDKVKSTSEERERLNQELKLYLNHSILEEAEKAKEITFTYEQALIDIEKAWTLKVEKAQEQFEKDTEELAQLNTDIQALEDGIQTTVLDAELNYLEELEQTRLKFDANYKAYQATYNQKLKALNKDYAFVKENLSPLKALILEHRKVHLKNSEYPYIYHTDLEHIQKIKDDIKALITEIEPIEQDIERVSDEKIRIDTLIQWQEKYSTKIYIKDFLLHKVEHFREDEDKKT